MPADEKHLRAELPEFLDLLENVASYVGGLDLARSGEVSARALLDLSEGLRRALDFLHELLALRGEPLPSPEPGVAFGSLGPSLRRTLPQRLAAQLTDELNALPGSRLEDISQFAAFGLVVQVADLLRFVAYLNEVRSEAAQRTAPPRAPVPHAPPVPTGPGPDLSAYGIRIDEAGERIEAGGATVWFAAAPGPFATGEGLAASFGVTFPGGVAFAVAEGDEASLGARLASVVAVRAFCRAASANPAVPGSAVRTAQNHLDLLLSALLSAGNATEAFSRVRGSIPPENARRILSHTRHPEAALRRVTPALSTSLLGAVAVLSGGAFRVSVVRLGPGLADARISGRLTPILGGSSGESAPLLGPGVRGAEDVERTDSTQSFSLSPGDALLLGTPALARGATGAWNGLSTLWPPFPEGLSSGETARDLLRRAERWGQAEPPCFDGPLGLALFLAR